MGNSGKGKAKRVDGEIMPKPLLYLCLEDHMKHHTLNLSEFAEESKYVCAFCMTPGFGPSYKCGTCDIRIHRYCATMLGNNLTCRLHGDKNPHMSLHVLTKDAFDCGICGQNIIGIFLKCPNEEFRVHPYCLKLRYYPQNLTPGGQENSSLHEHPLMEVYRPEQYSCNGCGTKGMGSRFRCAYCDFNVHPDCFRCHKERKTTSEPCKLCGDGKVHPLCDKLRQEEKEGVHTSAGMKKVAKAFKSAKKEEGVINVVLADSGSKPSEPRRPDESSSGRPTTDKDKDKNGEPKSPRKTVRYIWE